MSMTSSAVFVDKMFWSKYLQRGRLFIYAAKPCWYLVACGRILTQNQGGIIKELKQYVITSTQKHDI